MIFDMWHEYFWESLVDHYLEYELGYDMSPVEKRVITEKNQI